MHFSEHRTQSLLDRIYNILHIVVSNVRHFQMVNYENINKIMLKLCPHLLSLLKYHQKLTKLLATSNYKLMKAVVGRLDPWQMSLGRICHVNVTRYVVIYFKLLHTKRGLMSGPWRGPDFISKWLWCHSTCIFKAIESHSQKEESSL